MNELKGIGFKKREWTIDSMVLKLRKNVFMKLLKKGFNLYYKYFFVKTLKKNAVFYEKHLNETCYIIGNGVSIKNIELNALNSQFTFCCNEIHTYSDFNNFCPNYYIIIEPYYGLFFGKEYYDQTISLYSELYHSQKNKNITFFFHVSLKRLLKKNGLFKNEKVYFSFTADNDFEIKPDLTNSFHFGRGALSFMMGLSHYMGFEKIYLLGCGYSYSPRQIYHCYNMYKFTKETFSEIELNEELAKIRHDSNQEVSLFELNDFDEYLVPIFTVEYLEDRTHIMYKELNDFMNLNK